MKPGNIRITTQLRLGFALLLALLAGLGVLSHVQTGRLWENARKMHEHSLVVRRAVGDLSIAVVTMRLEFRNFALAGDEADRQTALANRAAAEADARRQFDILQDRYTGPVADVDAARRAFARWTELHEDNLGLVRADKTVEAMDRSEKSGDVGRTREHLLEHIHTISEFSRRMADQLFDDTHKAKEAQFHQTVFFSFLALALALAVSWLLTASIREPLKELSQAMDRFRRGEGEARSAYVSANEFGLVSAAFNEMAETMETQARINDQAAQLAGIMLRESEARIFCREVLHALMSHTGSQIGAVYLLNEAKTDFEHFESIGLSADRRASFSAEVREGEFGPALAAGRMQRISDIPADSAFSLAAVSGELRPREIITLPLQVGKETIAVISLARVSAYEDTAVRLLEVVSGTVAARLNGVLAYRQIRQLADRLEAQNRELEEQKRELAAQNTEMETLNRELEIQKAQLEEVSRLKSAFLSNMSHELRTPLNSVLALSEALAMQAGGRLSPEELSYLEIIERNGKNLLTLINDLLDLAKIEAGRMDVRPAPISLGQTLENLTASLAPLAGERNIALKLDMPAELPAMESDEIRVNQILQNLMANAVKFTDQGGVTVSAESDGQTIAVRVADTGIGIALEDLPHIFEEFRQVDASTSRRHEGTGLGLAIARKAARLLGGDITVESTPGQGSVFTLTLPVDWPDEAPDQVKVGMGRQPSPTPRPASAQEVNGSARESASSDRPRILLVEDNEAVVIQVKTILERAGYRVDVARGGKAAQDHIAHTVPDGIVLDLMMPEVDGFAVLEKLRATPAAAAVPVLILTAKDLDQNDLKRLKANHIQQLVQKGDVDREGLLARVRAMVGKFET
jgi:signal transduction histidine kinase/HAMP domain-containing protein